MDLTNENQINPSKIMQIGMGFWASKTLLTAVNMELFTHLAKGALSGQEIQNKLKSDDYPAYIIKSNVKGKQYYRVRIGPFESKIVCLKVIERIKNKKGCEKSYITIFRKASIN